MPGPKYIYIYILPPKKLKHGEYLAQFELLARKVKDINIDDKCPYNHEAFLAQLRNQALSSFYNYNSFVSKSNLNMTIEEKRALNGLSKNDQIIIIKSDKGRGVVVLNRSDYVNKVNKTFFFLSANELEPMAILAHWMNGFL